MKINENHVKQPSRLSRFFVVLFLTLFTLSVSATEYSQTTKLSFNMNNKTIKEVLRKIEEQTNFKFIYENEKINLDRKVSLEVKNRQVEYILKELFGNTGIDYSITDNNLILITPLVNNAELPKVQQSIALMGRVTDSQGEPIPGVNILLKEERSVGTISDVEGRYTFAVPNKDAILVFSFIGYVTQEITVGSQRTIDVVLHDDTEVIDEVVVVGYGTQKKSDLTGSIASVKADDIKETPARSVAEALQGKVAGVMVSKNSGKPGENADIIIRGVGSINGLNPLFVIDGVARGNNVNYNLKDVESIEVIKDASAAAIYGAQAAGGVVLITTKKGVYNQKAQIDFTANVGVRKMTDAYDLVQTKDYIPARQAIGQNYPLWENPASLPNTNWFDEVFQDGIEQSYTLSLTGGGEKISYYLSGGYERENGLQKSNYWERISARLNSDYKLSKNFTLGTRIYLARIKKDPFTTGMPWRTLPYMAPYNEDGSFAAVPDGVEFSGGNPVADVAYHHNSYGNVLVDADLFANWSIIDGLNLMVTGSAGFNGNYSDEFKEENTLGRTSYPDNYNKGLGYGESYTFTATLNYAKVFAEKHDLKAMIGYEAKSSNGANLSATATSFPVNNPLSFALSSNDKKTATGALSEGRFLSQFARVNYAFDNRYLLTMNIRRDGSPKFGPNNRWGVFPSASVGWKLTEESFFKDLNLKWITSVKPRFSWGILGNDAALNNFMYQQSYKTITLHSFDESSSISGYNSIKVINKNIKWEEIHTTNVGIDLALFSNKLTASFDYYKRNTKDMIYNLATPLSAGITEKNDATSNMPVNIGSIMNKGWELLISYRDQVGDFKYAVSGNFSQNRNEVIDLGLSTAYIYDGGEWPNDQAGGNKPFKTVNGQPIGQIWGLKTNGMITSQDEIDGMNQQAKDKYLADGGDPAKVGSIYYNHRLTGIGDLKYTDLNGDGRITNDDRTFIGNPWPKFQYGFNLYLAYKGFDISADLIGLAGRDVLNLAKSMERNFQQDFNSTYKMFEASYFMGNGLTDHPRIVAVDPSNKALVSDPNNNYRHYSDYLIEDGSYLKIKNLTVGYTFPQKWISKASLSRLRIYLTGHNLFTFTKFTGLDPEFSTSKTKYGNYSRDTYPQTKLFSVGQGNRTKIIVQF